MESGENPEQSGYCNAERTPLCMPLLRREGGESYEAESGYMFK